MATAIAVRTAIRDQNTLAAIFWLHWIVMMCGLMTEIYSRPAKNPDGSTNYDRWEGDPVPPVRMLQKWRSYLWRMLPHAIGIVPYTAAWWIIVTNMLDMIGDMCEKQREHVPTFVYFIIFGCFGIFSIFTFVQMRYQWTAPKHYWRTEVWYCILSATSKMFLGWLLVLNVLMKDDFNEAVAIGGENFTIFNMSMNC